MKGIWVIFSFQINIMFKVKYVTAEGSLHLNKLKNCWFLLFSGICKLINNGSYIAAFPPHEVILKYNFHLKKCSHAQCLIPFFILFYLNLLPSPRRVQSMTGPGLFWNPHYILSLCWFPCPESSCDFPSSGIPALEATYEHCLASLATALYSNTETIWEPHHSQTGQVPGLCKLLWDTWKSNTNPQKTLQHIRYLILCLIITFLLVLSRRACSKLWWALLAESWIQFELVLTPSHAPIHTHYINFKATLHFNITMGSLEVSLLHFQN